MVKDKQRKRKRRKPNNNKINNNQFNLQPNKKLNKNQPNKLQLLLKRNLIIYLELISNKF